MNGRGMAAFCILVALILTPGLFTSGAAARSHGVRSVEETGPALLIAADRITGFVPFTVTVYGRVLGFEPDTVELCRWKVQPLLEPRGEADSKEERPGPETRSQGDGPGACVTGRPVPSPGGYAYEHEIRFDQSGSFQIRLAMVGGSGRRVTSNMVRVSAF